MNEGPGEYKLFNTKSFAFRGRTINGHNNLMYRYKGMDGIKTGYTNASGFNLVSAVRDGNRRVIGVVMGGRSAASRDKIMEKLIAGNIARASGGTQLLASNSTRVGMDLARLGDNVPVPAPRQDAVAAVIGLASASPVAASTLGTAYAQPVEVAAAAVASDVAPLNPQAELPLAKTAAATGAARGWQIQIAAASSAELAMDLLADAKAKIGGALADRDTYTEAVIRDGSTFYRARFTGFASKTEARSVCDQLVKNRYDCVLMPARG